MQIIEANTSSILSATRNLFDLCMLSKDGNHEVIILVNGSDMACLDDVSLDSWCKTTSALVHVSKMISKDAHISKEF